ncbi:hypothetical protein Moror_6227 [Moniliophthora roreri MCA 2997]|uniref:Protein kinase domain-containing protein n=2 Tax=Moniliophthora roreri TaxID=221103 RepID=V2WV51_MONRO|nr:hypothetical protein Moror_6227 [Moniliophthora roreri MCA 2997]KAI3621548.1 hypothetical protein WG66_017030 [Moniliophthora roreri]
MASSTEENPKAELFAIQTDLSQFAPPAQPRDDCLEALLDHGYIGKDKVKRSTPSTRRRTIFRFWPRDPNGAVLRCSPPGMRAPNATSLWGSTLYDFYHTNRIPSVTSSVTKTTGNKLMKWCRENGELDWAPDEIAWAEMEAGPRKIEGPNPVEMYEVMVDMKVPQTKWAKSILESQKDSDDVANHRTPFHPSSYPPPYPTPPFSCSLPRLEETVPIHLLPQKLIVHDPNDVLCATNPRPSSSEQEKKRDGEFVDMWPFDSSNPLDPQGYTTRTYDLDLCAEAKAKVEETRASISATTIPTEETVMHIFPSTTPGPTTTPLIRVTVPARPPKPTHTPEAHLYLTMHQKKGQGNHSYVYDAEWEIPRWWFVDPTICLGCVEEKARAVWEAQLTKQGQGEESGVVEVERGCRAWFNVGEDVPEDTEDLKKYLEKLEKSAAEIDAMDVDGEKAKGDVDMHETTSADIEETAPKGAQPLSSKLIGAFSAAAASVVSIPDSGIVLYDSEKPRSPTTPEDFEMAPPITTAPLDDGVAKGSETSIHSNEPSTTSPTSALPETDSLSPTTIYIPVCAIPSDALRVWPSLPVPKGKVVGQVEREMKYLEPEEEVIYDVTHEHVVREVNEQKSRRKAAQDEKEKAGKPETQWLDDMVREAYQRQSKKEEAEAEAEAKPYETFVKAGTELDDTVVKYLSYTTYAGEMRTIHITSVPWLLPGDAPCSKHPRSSSITPEPVDVENGFLSSPSPLNLLQNLSNTRTPPTMRVQLTAKLGMEDDLHLSREGLNYQKFDPTISEHWTGYNVAYPLHEPTPCGAITPAFYGFYKPREEEDTEEYLSPILLLEDCGQPISPETLCLDDRYECSALVLRFHYLGWAQGSFYPRNILMRPDSGGEEGRNKRRFRLIDFGRASYIVDKEEAAGDDEEAKKTARNEWDKVRFEEKCMVAGIMALPFPM